MGQFIEYHVGNEKDCYNIAVTGQSGDVGIYTGRQWRTIKKLVKECEAGMHPHITYISRATYVTSTSYGLVVNTEFDDDEMLYENEVTQ
jgi:hypothetical protein